MPGESTESERVSIEFLVFGPTASTIPNNTYGTSGKTGKYGTMYRITEDLIMSFDTAAARESLRQREALRQKRLEELETKAERDACRIIEMLKDRYNPARIYRWGSLLRPGRFREWSDIDIALEGLSDPLAGLRALDDACRMTDFPVDLVELDRIDPRHAYDIRREGKLVYERKG